MSLRLVAAQDLGAILEDGVLGFGWPIKITDPSGTFGTFTGFSDDIAQLIDPDTGQAVSGRLISAALRISALTAKGLGLPVGIADRSSKPWVVEFDDIDGNPYTFKVSSSSPDRALGIVTCTLELYEK